MAITAGEAREQILEDLAVAIDRMALATACLGAAYDRLSVTSADRLEAELFRPAQKGLGRSKRTYLQFAERRGLQTREFESPSAPGSPSQPVATLIEQAVAAAAAADGRLAELQDSMLPIEFGDGELRTGLAEARTQLAELPTAAREFLRTLGR